MSITSEYRQQDATYWAPNGPDGFGGFDYAAPEAIKVRWQRKNEQFRDDQGVDHVSSHVVYPGKALEIGGYLYEGVSSESVPTDQDGAREIRQFAASPNLDNTEVVYKAWL